MTKRLCDLLAEKAALAFQKRSLRFFLTGILNSLFGFLVYSLVILLSTQVWFALLSGTCTGILFNFATTGGIVFKDMSIQRLPSFAYCYFFIYAVNYTLIKVLSIWIEGAILSQALLTPFIAIVSYFLLARFVFNDSGNAENRSR